eukprot:g80031.t1
MSPRLEATNTYDNQFAEGAQQGLVQELAVAVCGLFAPSGIMPKKANKRRRTAPVTSTTTTTTNHNIIINNNNNFLLASAALPGACEQIGKGAHNYQSDPEEIVVAQLVTDNQYAAKSVEMVAQVLEDMATTRHNTGPTRKEANVSASTYERRPARSLVEDLKLTCKETVLYAKGSDVAPRRNETPGYANTFHSGPAQSLDEDGDGLPTLSSSAAPTSLDEDDDGIPTLLPSAALTCLDDVVYSPHAVKLCSTLLHLLPQLKGLAPGPQQRVSVSRFAEDSGDTHAELYELKVDHIQGSLSVTRVKEVQEGLDDATRQARQSLSHEILQRKADIRGLEQEAASLVAEMQESKGEGLEALSKQFGTIQLMIGKHKQIIKELQGRSEVAVKVKVERVSTCVEVFKYEDVSVHKEVRMVPKRGKSIYVMGGTPDTSNLSIYVMGGTPDTSNLSFMHSSVERYDAEENKWELVGPMCCKRQGLGSAVLRGKIYAIGGLGNVEPYVLKSVECFSFKSGMWGTVAPLPSPRSGCAVGALNGRLLVAGGFDGQDCLSSVYIYEPTSIKKEYVAPMLVRRCYAAAAVLDGFFYVLGGRNGGRYWNTVERYDPFRDQWELVAPMNRKRVQSAAVACHGFLYVLGGMDDTAELASVERYDPKLNRWVEVYPMLLQRDGMAAAVLDGKLYAMGGRKGKNYHSSIERYDPATNRWKLLAPMSSPRAFYQAVVTH